MSLASISRLSWSASAICFFCILTIAAVMSSRCLALLSLEGDLSKEGGGGGGDGLDLSGDAGGSGKRRSAPWEVCSS